MTIEDQIAALFANANPVPSLDVFDPVEPLDIDRLERRPERSSDDDRYQDRQTDGGGSGPMAPTGTRPGYTRDRTGGPG